MDESYYFYDSNHGDCLRIMYKIAKDKYIINGGYGKDEGKKGHWAAILTKKKVFSKNGKEFNCIIDFSMKEKKTHDHIYYANWNKRKIKWQDGNEWLQLYF